ncbi:hypothetical protein TNCV_2569961 [Trichonephila clavipes]|nr:hypothetical protein TNCV_2569961 [Trichonephila clavipes]
MAVVSISREVPIKQFQIYARCQGIFDVKEAPRTGRPVVENVDETTQINEIDQHVSSRSNAQQLKIDHKTVLNICTKLD